MGEGRNFDKLIPGSRKEDLNLKPFELLVQTKDLRRVISNVGPFSKS